MKECTNARKKEQLSRNEFFYIEHEPKNRKEMFFLQQNEVLSPIT